MPALKNKRHELFARHYAKTAGIGAEAYRRVYPRAKPDTTARTNAARLLAKANVFNRAQELFDIMITKADVTIDNILTEYEEARVIAKEQKRSAEMQSASERKAKLVGLLRDRIEAGNVGDFDGTTMTPTEIIEQVANDIGPEAALKLAEAFGLTEAKQTELEQAKPISDAVN